MVYTEAVITESNKVEDRQERYRHNIRRLAGSMPWLKPSEKRDYRAKVFKSGNSLALRLPAELGLTAGMEMNLRVEGNTYIVEPIDAPKRRFAIDKVWGSASALELIKSEDRLFEERAQPTADDGSAT